MHIAQLHESSITRPGPTEWGRWRTDEHRDGRWTDRQTIVCLTSTSVFNGRHKTKAKLQIHTGPFVPKKVSLFDIWCVCWVLCEFLSHSCDGQTVWNHELWTEERDESTHTITVRSCGFFQIKWFYRQLSLWSYSGQWSYHFSEFFRTERERER